MQLSNLASFTFPDVVSASMQGIIVSKGMLTDHSMQKVATALGEAVSQTKSKGCEV